MKNSLKVIRPSLFRFFFVFAVMQSIHAQDATEIGLMPSTHKPSSGEFGVGVKAAGLKNMIWENSFDSLTIQLRRVQSQSLVLRTDIGMDFNSHNTSFRFESNTGSGYGLTEDLEKNFTIVIAPGLERHFKGTQRLDPYVGAALPLVFVSKTTTTSNDENVSDDGDYSKHKLERTTPGRIGIGLDGLVGVNYFMFNRLSLGIEYKLGFSLVRLKGKTTSKTTIREKINGAPETVTITENNGNEETSSTSFFGNKGVLGLNLNFYFGSKE